MFFFFQAEDGILELVRSRGLGYVYKRQVVYLRYPIYDAEVLRFVCAAPPVVFELQTIYRNAVSYTHLTLPTSDLV